MKINECQQNSFNKININWGHTTKHNKQNIDYLKKQQMVYILFGGKWRKKKRKDKKGGLKK